MKQTVQQSGLGTGGLTMKIKDMLMEEQCKDYLADDRLARSFNNSFSDRFLLGEIIDMEIKKTGMAVCGMSFLSALHSLGYAVVLKERALQ